MTGHRPIVIGIAICALTLSMAPGVRAADSTRAPDSARASAVTSPARGIRYLYLIRHGMYDRDTTGTDRSMNGLNALGHAQARLLGARLAGFGVSFSSFVTSDFTRARETAGEIGRALGISAVEDTLIHECTPTTARAEYSLYHTREENALCDAQLQAAWEKYVSPSPAADAHDILVCHGNVIRWFVGKALGLEATHWYAMEIANASLTVIAVRSDGTARLVVFSDVGHIPVEKQTWTGRGMGLGAPSPR